MSKLDTLQEKPWHIQLALFGAVALLFYAAFWYFVTSGTREETRQVEENVGQLQRENARAQIASQRLDEFKLSFARVQADYDDLKALLPEQRELSMVLQGIQDRARGQLTLMSFKPKPDEVQQDFCSGKQVEVVVGGTYNKVGQFFAQMAAYQRIVSITDFSVSKVRVPPVVGGRLSQHNASAKFLLTAYYVSAEKLQSAAPPQPAGGAPAPAAGQPAAPTIAAQPPAAVVPAVQGQGK